MLRSTLGSSVWVAAMLAVGACNAITGVDDIEVTGSGGAVAQAGSAPGGASSGGAGATGATGGTGAHAGQGTGATGATTGTGGDGTGATGATGSGGDGASASGGTTGAGGEGAGGGGPVCAGPMVPDFELTDTNPASASYNTSVSPRDYLSMVSAWYFGNAL